MNQAYEKIIPIRREEIIGRRTTEVFPSTTSDWPDWIAPYARAALDGESSSFERLWPITGRWYKVLIFSPQREHFVAIVEDIDDRKKAEEDLRKSQRKDELLAGVTSQLLSAIETQSIIDDLARRTMKFLDCDVFFNYLVDEKSGGISLNAYAGVPKKEMKSMMHLDFGVAVCGRVAQGGERIIVEDILLRSEDDRTPFLRSQRVQAYACHPLLVEGKVIGTLSFGTRSRTHFTNDELAVMREVSGYIAIAMYRLMENRALAEREQNYRHLLQYAPIAIYEIDYNVPRFRSVNEAMCQISGYSQEELLAMNPLDLLDEESKERFKERIERGVRGERIDESVEFRVTTKDGRELWAALNIKLNYKDGKLDSALVVGHDVTERKKIEENLKHSNEELRQFAYIASHDLKEPIRMVSSYLGLLERKYKGKVLDDKAEEYLSFALQGSERMNELVNDLLEYSRVNTRGTDFSPIGMNGVVERVIDLLRVSINESKAEVIVDPLPRIKADEGQMIQVFLNLIGNAIKFRGKVRPRIHISATRLGRFWQFAIEDNGIGIDAEYHERIFQMFQRLHSREEYEGTGIGLAISKKIVERHGGRIWVESEEGKGSTFFFTISR